VKRSLGIRPGARLACVTVIAPPGPQQDETALHRHHAEQLRQWVRGLDLHGHQVSFHVLQADDVAAALLAYAQANQVTLMVLGAATHGLALQRWIPTVPARVAAEAPCSVLLVRDAPPLALLHEPEALRLASG
jgi:eukaryotic-like serine/threonine-protein kinase